jgi:hypothetical protein
MLMACVITCTQFKRDYVDAIDMWDAARRVWWVEVWVKKVWVGALGSQFVMRNDDQINLPPLSLSSMRREVSLILVRIEPNSL